MAAQSRSGSAGQPSVQDQGTADVDVLAEHLGALARTLQAEDDSSAMLDEVVAAAVRLIPGVQEASISVVERRRRVTSEHRSGELPERVDVLQNELGEGPCLDAIFEQKTVRVPDMRQEQRWPRFARRVSELGVGSMLSFQLFVDGDTLGALNLISRDVDAFDDGSEQVGLLFASHAAVAFADARKIDHLALAVDSRDLIGQAKGMLMERYKINDRQAFSVLIRASQSSHRKLLEVAQELVTTGQLQQLQQQPEQDERDGSDQADPP